MLRGIVGAAVVARLGIKRFLTASAALADGYRFAMGVCAALAVAASATSTTRGPCPSSSAFGENRGGRT